MDIFLIMPLLHSVSECCVYKSTNLYKFWRIYVHNFYHNLPNFCTPDTTTCVCLLWPTVIIARRFEEMLVSAPWRWQDNCAETCRSYVTDYKHKWQNSAFVSVTSVGDFIIRHRRYNVKLFSFLNNQPDALIIKIYSITKLYVFRESSLPIIKSFLLYIRQW